MNTRVYVRLLILFLALFFHACSTSSSVARREATPPPDRPDAAVEAQSHYDAAMEAMNRAAWIPAQSELEQALALLDARPDSPGATEAQRALRAEIEYALDAIPSVDTAYADEDTLYDEEDDVAAGWTQLLEMLPSEPAPDRPAGITADSSGFDIPVVLHPRVIAAVRLLQTAAFPIFSEWLNRVNRYAPMIRSIFERAGIPQDLSYVALIASGYHPRAVANTGAAGLWQFSLETARALGLRRTAWIDDRYDVRESTRAAARHFQQLYDRLGDWTLVVAAHFGDAARIEQAMASNGTKDYWRMALPPEMMHAVPLVMAAALIAKHPETYGFHLQSAPPLAYETVAIDRSLSLEAVADGMEVPLEQLQRLNPELRAWRAPPGGYMLKIPIGTRPGFLTWAGMPQPAPPPLEQALYTVRRGDTISRIARRYRVSIDDLIAENEIRRPNRLKIGQVLFIPVPAGRPRTYAARRPASKGSKRRKIPARPVTPPTGAPITHRVRRGETLEAIGRRYHVSVIAIQQWNGIRNPRHLRAGQSLTIWKPENRGVGAPSGGRASRNTALRTGYYTVKYGDTLWDIALFFNMTVRELRTANRLRSGTIIHPGDRLKIPASSGAASRGGR